MRWMVSASPRKTMVGFGSYDGRESERGTMKAVIAHRFVEWSDL